LEENIWTSERATLTYQGGSTPGLLLPHPAYANASGRHQALGQLEEAATATGAVLKSNPSINRWLARTAIRAKTQTIRWTMMNE